jgi:diguanylate cyclase (GGDEF)-like protein/PAS domain S-box-containing protein
MCNIDFAFVKKLGERGDTMTVLLRVLIIGDTDEYENIVVCELLRGGYRPSVTRVNTKDDMKKALAGSFDLVVSEYMLHTFAAIPALVVLKQFGRDIPFIVLTKIAAEEAVVTAVKAGASEYISMVNLPRFLLAVEECLAEATERREQKKLQEEISAGRRFISTTMDSLTTQIAIVEQNGLIVYTNKAWQDFGHNHQLFISAWKIGENYFDICQNISDETVQQSVRGVIEAVKKVVDNHSDQANLEYVWNIGGKLRWFKMQVTPFASQGSGRAVIATEDITERKEMEERVKYLSMHDALTGLFNRAYFEMMLSRHDNRIYMPVGIIMCDINGLKLVNDTLGRETGDVLLLTTARILTQSFSDDALVARIGGDEFAVLLTNTSPHEVELGCKCIRRELTRHNADSKRAPLSLSIGFSVAESGAGILGDYLKEAENEMYRQKLHSEQSARSTIVNTVMKLLEARDFITEGHADRLQDVAAELGLAIGLSESKIADLRLLAQFHDIGKVGIPDYILFKPGPLTAEEFEIMKSHSEIGYRIARSSPDLSMIAEQILKHHEWWNGGGYPLGLKGASIPLECRILTIADAYDAMTSDRPYRKAMSHQAALSELKRYAGLQFDAELVNVFANIKLHKNKSHCG